MTRRWFINSPLELHRRWTQKKKYNLTSTKHEPKRIIGGRYKLLHEIGYGASGIVHLAIDSKTNVKYAIKELNKSKLQRSYHSELLFQSGPHKRTSRPVTSSSETLPLSLGVSCNKKRKLNAAQEETIVSSNNNNNNNNKEIEEVRILKNALAAQHKNIVKFVEVINNDSENNDSIFIVMEYVENGIVMDITPHSTIKPYSNLECRKIFKQLVEAVDHLHQSGIIHRDIKPQNLMLSSNNIIKLIDFGSATTHTTTMTYNSIGTPAFMAPELLKKAPKNRKYSPTTCDVWSMGVTLYCLVYGHLPFEKSSLSDLYEDIRTKEISHSSINKIDPDLVDLIDKLLKKNPADRIELKDIKLHPWMNK